MVKNGKTTIRLHKLIKRQRRLARKAGGLLIHDDVIEPSANAAPDGEHEQAKIQAPAPAMPVLAFEVELEDMTTIIFTHTAASAKMAAVIGWRNAGYGSDGRWPTPLKARRKPWFDRAARMLKARRAYSESYVSEICH